MKGMCDICGSREGQRTVIVTGMECWVCARCSGVDNESLSADAGLVPSAAKETVSQHTGAHGQAPVLISPDGTGRSAGVDFKRLDELWSKITAEHFEIQTLETEAARIALELDRKRAYSMELLTELRLQCSMGKYGLSQLSPMVTV